MRQSIQEVNNNLKFINFASRLINDFSNLFQPIFLAVFIWSTVAICVTMMMVQMEIVKHSLIQFAYSMKIHLNISLIFQTLNVFNSIIFVALFFDVSYAFGSVFVLCELAQQISEGFNEMNDVIGQFYWPQWPIEVQRLLPTVLAVIQRPIDFTVFGTIGCNRAFFKKVNS